MMDEQQMDIGEIIQVAAPRQAPEYPPMEVIKSIMQELNAPGVDSQQFGNTVFITHQTQRDGFFIFRALNADTPQNYIYNVIDYLDYAENQLGAQYLVSDFTDPTIINIAKAAQRILQQDPNSAIQYAVQRKYDGTGFRMTIKLRG